MAAESAVRLMSTRARPSPETNPRLKAMSGTFSTAIGLSDQAAATASIRPAARLPLPGGGPSALRWHRARVRHRRLSLRILQGFGLVGLGEHHLFLILGEWQCHQERYVPLQIFDEGSRPKRHVPAE